LSDSRNCTPPFLYKTYAENIICCPQATPHAKKPHTRTARSRPTTAPGALATTYPQGLHQLHTRPNSI
jgi:hypothetical protein